MVDADAAWALASAPAASAALTVERTTSGRRRGAAGMIGRATRPRFGRGRCTLPGWCAGRVCGGVPDASSYGRSGTGALAPRGSRLLESGPVIPTLSVVNVKPSLSYLICTTPRSGSTLLCEALENTGVAGRPE